MMKKVLVVFAAAAFALGVLVHVQSARGYEKMLKKPKARICGMCHADIEKSSNASGHGVQDVTCDMCHNPHGTGNEKMLVKPAAEICFQCHFAEAGHGKVDVTCQMCHNPHGTPDDAPKKDK